MDRGYGQQSVVVAPVHVVGSRPLQGMLSLIDLCVWSPSCVPTGTPRGRRGKTGTGGMGVLEEGPDIRALRPFRKYEEEDIVSLAPTLEVCQLVAEILQFLVSVQHSIELVLHGQEVVRHSCHPVL
ncbi:hypothetical protein NDU88_001879 [Pleurodeles waltl]|uniref:Uncharacterized protein n=1 Tax=Pleurodeles waltl TaxID=8319 RepID=A0AAV7T0M0_PLEWA|nr:hypothetical protein NDU88_001879 [Pleurodeles waltl]